MPRAHLELKIHVSSGYMPKSHLKLLVFSFFFWGKNVLAARSVGLRLSLQHAHTASVRRGRLRRTARVSLWLGLSN